MKAGDRWAVISDRGRISLFIEVVRVAKDGSWADIHCRGRSKEWSKRQQLSPAGGIGMAREFDWTQADVLAAWPERAGIV